MAVARSAICLVRTGGEASVYSISLLQYKEVDLH